MTDCGYHCSVCGEPSGSQGHARCWEFAREPTRTAQHPARGVCWSDIAADIDRDRRQQQ